MGAETCSPQTQLPAADYGMKRNAVDSWAVLYS